MKNRSKMPKYEYIGGFKGEASQSGNSDFRLSLTRIGDHLAWKIRH